MNHNLLRYLTKRGYKNHLRQVTRKKTKRRLRASAHKHYVMMKRYAFKTGKVFRAFPKKGAYMKTRPPFLGHIRFLERIPNLFSPKKYPRDNEGHFELPKCFSLIDNHKETFDFLKRLFVVLHKGKAKKIVLDYKKCERIDVDASICMDVILAEFIEYWKYCRRVKYTNFLPGGIVPINFESPAIKKVLFSIGAFSTIRNLKIDFDDVEPLPVLVNRIKGGEHIWAAKNEIDLTKIVEYIKRCIGRLGRELTTEAETEFYKVIGEVMSNAEEHASVPVRYAIGFFQEMHEENEHYGFFNFCIFNFGDTIYQTFKSPNCRNRKAVEQMQNLSKEYTKKGWLQKPDFEEETLWTLYALQEGVTSKAKKRGNGSIQFIENFFRLRGELENDQQSKMLILSGNTRILFDGKYGIEQKNISGQAKPFKMITFNKSGLIEDEPDKKYVTFAPHYFPGTLICARILIKDKNTNKD